MSYVALYRSYRPKFFSEVVGQKVIVKTLENALLHNKIGHAYIFNGPRGTGKTSVAKIFAKAVNCLENGVKDACGKCKNCISIDKNEVSDIIEIDAASYNQVDSIRELRDNVKYTPSVGKYKVYIIDEVHMLTPSGFNALLKTLEEPPKHVIFILATTEIHKIPATILSRCQRFDFKNIDNKDIFLRLKDVCIKEKIDISDEAIEAICNNAEGGLRDALSLLDQVVSYSDSKITENDIHSVAGSLSHETLTKLLLSVNKKESTNAMSVLDGLIQEGKEITRIVSGLILSLRDCLIEKTLNVEKPKYKELSGILSTDKIYFYLDILNQLQSDMKSTTQKRAYIEVAIFKMMNHKTVIDIDYSEMIINLKADIEELKVKLDKRPVEAKTVIDKEKGKPLITVNDVKEILYNSDKDKKAKILKAWDSLKNYKDEKLKGIASLVSEAELVATSDTKMLLVFDKLEDCKQLMSKNIKENALKIFNKKSELFDDILAIRKTEWIALFNVFKSEYDKNTNPRPKLPNIDLKLYEEEIKKKEKKSDCEILAEEFFGKDKLIVKGE